MHGVPSFIFLPFMLSLFVVLVGLFFGPYLYYLIWAFFIFFLFNYIFSQLGSSWAFTWSSFFPWAFFYLFRYGDTFVFFLGLLLLFGLLESTVISSYTHLVSSGSFHRSLVFVSDFHNHLLSVTPLSSRDARLTTF